MSAFPEHDPSYERHFTLDTGWAYATVTENGGDCRKLWHYAVCDEDLRPIDWDPYSLMEPDQLALWFSLGEPKRQGPRPLNPHDLNHLATRKIERVA